MTQKKNSPVLLMSGWIEFCWGFWVIQNPPIGVAAFMASLPGGQFAGIFLLLWGAFRLLCFWRNWWFPKATLVSIVNFSALLVFTVYSRGWDSGLSLMYFGFLCSQACLLARDVGYQRLLKETSHEWMKNTQGLLRR